MARSWKFSPSDLVVDMRKPADCNDLLAQEELAAKHDCLRDTFGAWNFIFLGFENDYQGSTAPRPIRVHAIYATFEVARCPAQEIQKQERLTKEGIAGLCPPNKARSNKRRFEELCDDDERPVVCPSTAEVHTRNTKRRTLQDEENWPAHIEGNTNEALYHSEQSAQAFQKRPLLSEPSSRVTPGTARELGGHSEKERIAAGIAQARAALTHAAQNIELGPKADGPTFARSERPNLTKHLHGEGKIPSAGLDRSSLEKEKELIAETQHPGSKMSVISQAAALWANRDELILPLNSARAKSKTSSYQPQPAQAAHRSQKCTIEFRDRFLKTTTEACSGVFYETRRHDICSELQAHEGYIGKLLFTHKDSCGLLEDARKAMVNGVITQLLVGFEKTWSESHPEVTVPAVGIILDRRITHLTLDVAIKCGHVADVDELDLLMHITAVPREKKSRQLVFLRAITESLRRNAQSKRPVVAPLQDQKTKLPSSMSPPSKQVPSMSDGLFKSAVKTRALVIDEVTGLASVMQAGDSEKDVDDRSSPRPQKKNLKRKQGAETPTSCKRPKKINAHEDDTEGASREQPMVFESSVQDTGLYGESHKTQNDFEKLLHQEGSETEPHGTIMPAKLVRPASVLPRTTFTPELIGDAPAPDKRGFMDVTDVFKAHGYNILSEEERTENLLRHRQANRARLGEQSPLRDAEIESVDVEGFCYATPTKFNGFGFEDELELADDTAPGLSLDSRGLWNW